MFTWTKKLRLRRLASERNIELSGFSLKQTYTLSDIFKLTNHILDVPQELYGLDYLRKISANIWQVFEFKYVFVGYALKPDYQKVQTVVSMVDGNLIENFVYDLKGTPCENVFSGKRVCVYPSDVVSQFPEDKMLEEMGAESYIGAPTIVEGKLFGLVAILDVEKIVDEELYSSFIEFIAARISVELERYTHQHQLEHLRTKVYIDPVTNCLNRQAFNEAIENQFFEYKASAMMFVDADHFKEINDTKGHQYGDQVLKFIASTLTECTRESDLVCRYGGEEFIIYLPDGAVDVAVSLADRIHQSLLSNPEFDVTVSIGITNSIINENIDDVISRADKALYKAKQNGRNRTEVILKDSA